jgi:energy-coupling factor transport system ATP-binding protein
LLDPQVGSAQIEAEPLTRQSARGRVGLVFQDAEAQLFADTLLDDVAFGPKNLGVPAPEAGERAREALTAVGLDPAVFSHRSPFSLSGGEARRAAIAGVLAMRPLYLLADEPTAGLDASGRRALRRLLLEAKRDAGVVVVSHSAEEFLGEADRVVVLSAGRSAWYGEGDDLVRDPSILGRAGLSAPAVLELQWRMREAGLYEGDFTLDPIAAAENLAVAGRRG